MSTVHSVEWRWQVRWCGDTHQTGRCEKSCMQNNDEAKSEQYVVISIMQSFICVFTNRHTVSSPHWTSSAGLLTSNITSSFSVKTARTDCLSAVEMYTQINEGGFTIWYKAPCCVALHQIQFKSSSRNLRSLSVYFLLTGQSQHKDARWCDAKIDFLSWVFSYHCITVFYWCRAMQHNTTSCIVIWIGLLIVCYESSETICKWQVNSWHSHIFGW